MTLDSQSQRTGARLICQDTDFWGSLLVSYNAISMPDLFLCQFIRDKQSCKFYYTNDHTNDHRTLFRLRGCSRGCSSFYIFGQYAIHSLFSSWEFSTIPYTLGCEPSFQNVTLRFLHLTLSDRNVMFDAQLPSSIHGRPLLFCISVLGHPGLIFVHDAWSVTLKGRLVAEGTVCRILFSGNSGDQWVNNLATTI
jgi:hypothetical protein